MPCAVFSRIVLEKHANDDKRRKAHKVRTRQKLLPRPASPPARPGIQAAHIRADGNRLPRPSAAVTAARAVGAPGRRG